MIDIELEEEKVLLECKEKYPLKDCINELINLTIEKLSNNEQIKITDNGLMMATIAHLDSLILENTELKSKVLRLLAYLTAFTKMCEKCCYPKQVCQCQKVKNEE